MQRIWEGIQLCVVESRFPVSEKLVNNQAPKKVLLSSSCSDGQSTLWKWFRVSHLWSKGRFRLSVCLPLVVFEESSVSG